MKPNEITPEKVSHWPDSCGVCLHIQLREDAKSPLRPQRQTPKPRDRCPRLFCFGTLRITRWTPIFWRARCEKCGRIARLDENFQWTDRRGWVWLVGLGFVGWFLLVLWLPEAVT